MWRKLSLCVLLTAGVSGCGINQAGEIFPWFTLHNDASPTLTFNGDRIDSDTGPVERTDKHFRVDSRKLYGVRDDDPWDMR